MTYELKIMSSDIQALEHEFSAKPTLDASIALSAMYLAQKRYMEAMVICKKGMKTAPSDWRGRLMLARIYMDQGKAPKAAEELAHVLRVEPRHAEALEMMGQSLWQQGHRDRAKNFLQQAKQAEEPTPVAPPAPVVVAPIDIPLIDDFAAAPFELAPAPASDAPPVKRAPILIVDDDYVSPEAEPVQPRRSLEPIELPRQNSVLYTLFLLILFAAAFAGAAAIGWYLGKRG
jgi:cellulose synthase operon protein C